MPTRMVTSSQNLFQPNEGQQGSCCCCARGVVVIMGMVVGGSHMPSLVGYTIYIVVVVDGLIIHFIVKRDKERERDAQRELSHK